MKKSQSAEGEEDKATPIASTPAYPWQSPQHDLAEARRLIEKHGYWRRKEELEDAEAALRMATASGA